MKTPLVRPAPLLFVESLVTTFPARRRVRGAMIAAVGAHLLAGTALYASGLVRFDALEKPVIPAYLVQSPYREETVMIGHLEQHAARKGEADAKGGGPAHPQKPEPANDPVKAPVKTPDGTPGIPVEQTPAAPPVTDPGDGGPGSGGGPGNPWGKTDGPIGTPTGTGHESTGNDLRSDMVASYGISEPPVVRSRVEPVYPEMARQQGLSGVVILEIVIDEQGRVIATRIMRTDNVIFNKSAEDAVRQWKYSSPKNDGRAVRTYKTVTVNFQLH